MSDQFEGGFLAGVQRRQVSSAATGTDHDLHIALPASYGATDRSYPLLVVLDANYCIGTAVESAAMQAATGEVQELIIVGVGTPGGLGAHTLRRLRDYTPGGADLMRGDDAGSIGKLLKARFEQNGLTPEQGLGGSRQFARFLSEELVPLLASEFRIKADDVGLAGHSCGGAFAIDLLLNPPSAFSKLIIGTFGVDWYDGGGLAALEARICQDQSPAPAIFVAIGGAELEDPSLGPAVKRATDFLDRLRAARPDIALDVAVFEGETHTSVLSILLSSGIRRLWSTGLSYSAAADGRRDREQSAA